MLLYHGSKDKNIKIFHIIPRNNNPPEFGDGVYFTSILNQAIEWSCRYNNTGAVYTIDIDLEQLNGINLRNRRDDEQALFYYTAYLNRINLRDIAIDCLGELDGIDYIFGDVIAETRKFITLSEQFNCGDIEIDQFIEKTKTIEKYEQYCFRSQKAINMINCSIKEIIYTKKIDGIISCDNVVER